jgi:xanthine/CO dehydrogenase XdhC/CoxF family maturation factor
MARTGDNSAWNFPQILGSFPYGLGVTTMAKAKALGATAGAQKNALKATQVWERNTWALELRFADDKADSTLRSLTMRYKNPSHDKIDMLLEDALKSRDYRVFRVSTHKAVLQYYELMAQGKDDSGIEEALGALISDSAPLKTVTIFYAPAAFVQALAETAQQGKSVRDLFAAKPDTVIVAYTHTYKDDMEVVTMAFADALAKEEK